MTRTSTRRVLLGLVAVVAVLQSGCGDDADTADPATQRQQWIAEMIAEGGSEFERPYLEDGVVTAAEREAAYLSYVSCMEEKGIKVQWYELLPTGDTISHMSDVLDQEEEDQVHDDCRADYYEVVGIVFAEQNAPTAEQEAEWLRQAGQCMRDLGHDVPPDPTRDEIMEIDAFEAADCYDEAAGIQRQTFRATP